MADKQWISLHQHTDISNSNYFEVVTQFKDYVAYAKEHGLNAVTSTEHGNVVRWIYRKELAEQAGLKYIHGMEAYVTMSLEGKEAYHTILLARNYDGVKEINKLSSNSFNRTDGHFYRKPRILFDELKQTFKNGNIYITTACLAGFIYQNKFQKDDTEEIRNTKKNIVQQWLDMAKLHKDMFYFEIQPHDNKEQAELNTLAIKYARLVGCHVIASNDVHALNPKHNELRMIVKKGKRNGYDSDDEFELWVKSYDEMVQSFQKQRDDFNVDIMSDEIIAQGLKSTLDIANSVEEFELDKSHKYPKLYKDPEKEFQKRIKQGLKDRGILDKPKEERKVYLDRVKHEYEVYKHNGAIDYMLCHEDILNAAHDNDIDVGYGRGSVSGSLIAYLCHQTEMDSVKLGLNFERFMNPERVSLADVDNDSYSQDQQWLQQWMLTNDKWHAASILTTNTYGLKGAIKAIADGMDRYAGKPQYIQSIRNQIDDKGNYNNTLYEEHKELFDNAKQIVGVIDSFGRHAAGVLIDTNTIDDHVGIQTISKWDYPVTQVTMKEIDHYNWVKFDMLGLDNVGLISKACKLAGLPYLTPDSTDIVDFEDKKVWDSMRDNNIGIFQFEADRAGQILKDLFAPDTIDKIENEFDNNKRTKVRYMDLLSLANAAQRPSGASYLYNVTHGIVKDNGHPALNEFLAPTLGNLVYQEQLIQFLVQFCGYTAGAADVIRRSIGKKLKEVIDEEVPKIHTAFVKTMTEKYGDSTEHAEKIAKDFMQVFMDAANYGFSINHSMAYSYIGYISTWLRYYYPLEWGTAACEIWKDKPEKIAKVTSYLESRGINIKPARFRKSRALYYMDKETNSIYEGIEPIKRVNEKAGEQLYSLRDNQYDTFTDLLLDIYEPIKSIQEGNYAINLTELYKLSSEKVKEIDKLAKCNKNIFIKKEKCVEVNKSIMLNLISLNYFDEFGGSELLADTYEKFIKIYKPKNKTLINKQKAYLECLEFERTSNNVDFPLDYQLKQQLELKGKISYSNDKLPNTYVFVADLTKMSNRYKLNIYSLKTGKASQILVLKRNYISQKIEVGDFINIKKVVAKPKIVNVNGKWTKSEDEREFWLEAFNLINFGKKDSGM
jgi:DNA polymerase-3 subunit alpha